MLATLAVSCAILTSPPGHGASQQTASQLVSKMLQYYYEAQSLTGTITYTASDGQGQVQVVTTLQFERPSKLYMKQVKVGGQAHQWLVTSDGKQFSYDSPYGLMGSEPGKIGTPGGRSRRLVESVKQPVPDQIVVDSSGKRHLKMADLDVRQIYAITAATIGDRSVPLDIAIGRLEDLQHDKLEWMTLALNGKLTFNGAEGNLIEGQWRQYGDQVSDPAGAPGDFKMLITDDGRLLSYLVHRKVGHNKTDERDLTETWVVDLTPNGKTDESLFHVVP